MLPGVLEDALAWLTSHPHFQPPLRVTMHDVHLNGLPAELDGLVITHVSDLHVGDGAWVPFRVSEARERILGARAQLTVNTGDFVRHAPNATRTAAIAACLRVNGKRVACPANLAVLGNHDYYAGDDAAESLAAELEGNGIHVLRNRLITVRVNGASLTVAGLTDHEPGFEKALACLQSSPRPRIALMHLPDLVECLPPESADLVLCGHTHGGQIALPGLRRFLIRRFSNSRHDVGWEMINGNLVYINAGLGCTGLPFRFRARPELTLLRLGR
ncbi:MAG: metallophosphoesterase [Chloroflexota bacterium]